MLFTFDRCNNYIFILTLDIVYMRTLFTLFPLRGKSILTKKFRLTIFYLSTGLFLRVIHIFNGRME
jgi:hypothetical protein